MAKQDKAQQKLRERALGLPASSDTLRLIRSLLDIPSTQVSHIEHDPKTNSNEWGLTLVLAAVPTFDGRHAHLTMYIGDDGHFDEVTVRVHLPDGKGTAQEEWVVSPSAKNLLGEIQKLIQELPTYADTYRRARQKSVKLV